MRMDKYFCIDLRTCALIIAGIEVISSIILFFTVGILFARKLLIKSIRKMCDSKWFFFNQLISVGKIVVTGCLVYGILAVNSIISSIMCNSFPMNGNNLYCFLFTNATEKAAIFDPVSNHELYNNNWCSNRSDFSDFQIEWRHA